MKKKPLKHKIKENNITNNFEIVDAIINQSVASKTDPNGSYTGKPIDRGETPVQDADDL